MKAKQLKIRLSSSRYDKLKLCSAQREKSMTQLIEEFIDSISLRNISTGNIKETQDRLTQDKLVSIK